MFLRYCLVCLSCCNKIPATGWLKNRHLLLTILEAGKSKCQQVGCLVRAIVFVYVLTGPLYMGRKRQRDKNQRDLVSLLVRPLIPSWAPTLTTSSEPTPLPKAPSSNTITLGVGALPYGFCGDTNIESITSTLGCTWPKPDAIQPVPPVS